MPKTHALYVEWMRSSSEANVAIRQNRPDRLAAIKASHDKSDAYIESLQADQWENRERLKRFLRRPEG